MTGRRLVLLFDGTDNRPKDRTNVWRTHELIAETDPAGVEQRKKYIQGVGTEIGELIRGSIFGLGVARKVREGYEWLVANYQDSADEIYVYGFSRGAFIARSLVQLLATCGLARRETLLAWDSKSIFERYADITTQDQEITRPIWRLRRWKRHPEEAPTDWTPDEQEARILDDGQVREVKIRMVGVWDTVGALGSDFYKSADARLAKSGEHNARPTLAQEHGFHALAIDEHRPMFEATLWRTFAEAGDKEQAQAPYQTKYEQRWFIGAHADVGGGYKDDDLPDFSLAWMSKKASELGLSFTHTVEPRPGAWLDPIHDSFKRFAFGVLNIWNELKDGDQRNYRQIGKLPRRVRTKGGKDGFLLSIQETIDESVLRRWSEDPTYRPPSLVEYFQRNPEKLPAGTSVAQRTNRIFACEYWNPTGVYLRPNATYKLRLVPGLGEPLRDKTFVCRSIEGEDWQSFAHKTASLLCLKRKHDAKWFSLIGTIDKQIPWIIRENEEFSVKVGGQLVCYFNDAPGFYRNNSGWVQLEIEPII